MARKKKTYSVKLDIGKKTPPLYHVTRSRFLVFRFRGFEMDRESTDSLELGKGPAQNGWIYYL